MPHIDKKYLVLNGSVLKIVAICTMFIDHIGAAVLLFLPEYGYVSSAGYDSWNSFYMMFRIVGRTAFPIFCFLLVEGFFHTKNVLHYGIRLLVFAFISEIPFDLAFREGLINWDYQNVYFTLFIGLCTIWGLDYLIKFIRDENLDFKNKKNLILAVVGLVGAVIIGAGISILLKTDYSYHGVFLIVIFYLLRNTRIMASLAGYFWIFLIPLESFSLPGFVIIQFYNGKRGLTKTKINFKYLFYAFYPVHLLLLYGIRCILEALAPM